MIVREVQVQKGSPRTYSVNGVFRDRYRILLHSLRQIAQVIVDFLDYRFSILSREEEIKQITAPWSVPSYYSRCLLRTRKSL